MDELKQLLLENNRQPVTIYFPCEVNMNEFRSVHSGIYFHHYTAYLTLELLDKISNLNLPFIMYSAFFSFMYRKYDFSEYKFYDYSLSSHWHIQNVLETELTTAEHGDIKMYKVLENV